MKIKMLVKIEGSRNGQRWPEAGTVIDLPEGEARDLIANRCAEKAKGAEPEPALAPPAPERATARKAATRKAAPPKP